MSPALHITGIYQPFAGAPLELPVYTCRVPASFPSPADDHLDGTLDLNKRYIALPAATFFVLPNGDSMKDAGIHSGDMLIVDRSFTRAWQGGDCLVSTAS